MLFIHKIAILLICLSLIACDNSQGPTSFPSSMTEQRQNKKVVDHASTTTNEQLSRIDESAKPLILSWSDGVSDYLSVLSDTLIEDPTSLIENAKFFTLSKVKKIPPFFNGTVKNINTYRVQNPSVSISLTHSEKPTVYLFGESHIGESQVNVAKELCQLLNEKEIDAIMVEQPSDSKLNWDNFRRLENNRDQAIANLQAQMIGEAADYESHRAKAKKILEPIEKLKKLKESPRGERWLSFWTQISSQSDVLAVLKEIESTYGESGLV